MSIDKHFYKIFGFSFSEMFLNDFRL